MKTLAALFAALALMTGSALAQTAPSASTADASADSIAQKFASFDGDKSGFLDGKELDGFKDKMAFLDMNRDGKVSPNEYNVGVMTGLIAK